MKPKILLRVAAALMLLHTIGHTMGALGSGMPDNPRVGAVLTGMRTEHFDFMGRSATLAQFFDGYGIILIFVLLFVSVQLWMLGGRPVKRMLIGMGLFLSVMAVCEYIYFFPMAAVFTLLAAVCVWLALARSGGESIEKGL
ncbi:MAG TPA: hypothetical protein VMH27_18090 [Puia sp.]|nr:hypothetical protein [Puia sp.]